MEKIKIIINKNGKEQESKNFLLEAYVDMMTGAKNANQIAQEIVKNAYVITENGDRFTLMQYVNRNKKSDLTPIWSIIKPPEHPNAKSYGVSPANTYTRLFAPNDITEENLLKIRDKITNNSKGNALVAVKDGHLISTLNGNERLTLIGLIYILQAQSVHLSQRIEEHRKDSDALKVQNSGDYDKELALQGVEIRKHVDRAYYDGTLDQLTGEDAPTELEKILLNIGFRDNEYIVMFTKSDLLFSIGRQNDRKNRQALDEALNTLCSAWTCTLDGRLDTGKEGLIERKRTIKVKKNGVITECYALSMNRIVAKLYNNQYFLLPPVDVHASILKNLQTKRYYNTLLNLYFYIMQKGAEQQDRKITKRKSQITITLNLTELKKMCSTESDTDHRHPQRITDKITYVLDVLKDHGILHKYSIGEDKITAIFNKPHSEENPTF